MPLSNSVAAIDVGLRKADGWILESSGQTIALPADHESEVFHQFRVVG